MYGKEKEKGDYLQRNDNRGSIGIGKIVTAVGIGIMFFGGMCDADGIYYYYLIAVIALGALVSLAGLAIMSVELRRAERRKACFYFIRRRDRLDADVEFIDLDKKIAP